MAWYRYIYVNDLQIGDEIEDNGEVIKVTSIEEGPYFIVKGNQFCNDEGTFSKDEVSHRLIDGERVLLLNR